MLNMTQINDIRRRVRAGEPVAKIARETGHWRNTVAKYADMEDFRLPVPVRRGRPSKLDDYKKWIDQVLAEDTKARRKQRHTAKRIHDRLVAERGARVSYTLVQRYVKKRKKEMGLKSAAEFLDLDWAPGSCQVDFGHADFRIGEVKVDRPFLVACFPYSNVGLAQVSAGETAECVIEALTAIFMFIGGVPPVLVFDNATGVGRRVGKEIRTSRLFAAFAAHYGFQWRLTNPHAGHEKGAVESKVGAIRRNLLVPVPRVFDEARYNERLLADCLALSGKDHYRKGEAEVTLFERDKAALGPLPSIVFEAVRWKRVKTDKFGHVTIDGLHRYSTDPAYGCVEVLVGLGAREVVICDCRGGEIARHKRAFGARPTDSVDPACQLSVLALKPAAWGQSRVRPDAPGPLRDWIDAAGDGERKEVLRSLRDLEAVYGYRAALAGLAGAIERVGRPEAGAAELLAAVACRGRTVVTYDEPADIAVYDAAYRTTGQGWQGVA